MLRRPAVSGQFYPGNRQRLTEFLEGALAPTPDALDAVGVISPHAGYVYSGAVAGAVFSRVALTDTVLLLGPNHTGMGTPASIMSAGSWMTPLGTTEIDSELAEALKRSCPLLEEDSLAHAREHSLEVQLPFLQYLKPEVRIVPIAFMLRDFDRMEEIGTAIADTLTDWPERVLIVVSSDMTHYESHESAKSKDAKAIDRVLALDARGLLDTVKRHGISMCGFIPATVLLVAAPQLGAQRGELVRYATSGETSGDYSSVVGYAGMIVH